MLDVLIIGGGPAGLYAAFYCGLRGMTTCLIEAQSTLGGKLNLYKDKKIWDIGGLPGTSGKQVKKQLLEQANTFRPQIVLSETVIEIEKETHFKVTTDKGQTYSSQTVIMANGTGIVLPKKLELEGVNSYEKTNLLYAVEDTTDFLNKDVLISGGGDSAIQWAKELAELAKSVTLVYRQDLFKGYETDTQDVLTHPKIHCHLMSRIVEMKGETMIKEVTIASKDGCISRLKTDVVLVCHGFERNNPVMEKNKLGLSLVEDYFVPTNQFGTTSVPGLFAAGDATDYLGKVRLIAGAFHDSVNAVNQAKQFVDPSAYDRGQVSSHHDELMNR